MVIEKDGAEADVCFDQWRQWDEVANGNAWEEDVSWVMSRGAHGYDSHPLCDCAGSRVRERGVDMRSVRVQ